jgi:hypothetical protein
MGGLIGARDAHDCVLTARIRDPMPDRTESVVGVGEVGQLQKNRALFTPCQSKLKPSAVRIVDDAVDLDSQRFARRVDHSAPQAAGTTRASTGRRVFS